MNPGDPKLSVPLRLLCPIRKHIQSGFSLIELIVVMVILALLIAAAVKYGPIYVANNRVKSATETFRAALGIARSEATKRNARVDMIMDIGTEEWRVQTQEVPPFVIRTGSFLDHKGITGPFTAGAAVTFDAFGRPTGGGPAFNFASTAGTCQTAGGEVRCLRVVLGAGGQATVCDPAMLYATNPGGCKP